jgi:diaminopimelate decarboxylase
MFLRPRLEKALHEILDAADLLHGLVTALGSPLNVVVPGQIVENLGRFTEVYRRHQLAGRIYFAHKANRSSALVRELAGTAAGVDVASLAELEHALAAGFAGDRIMATGPKDVDFLWLAARCGAVINADSGDELLQLGELVGRHRLPRTRIMLRLSAFEEVGVTVLSRPSRFGSHVRELDSLLAAVDRYRDAFELVGVAYHLDTNALNEKALALDGCLRAMDECRRRQLAPRGVDIGGGFGVNYLADRDEWERYTTELNNAVLGRRPAMTWQNHGYGLRAEAGTVRGTLGLYPAYRPIAAERYLDELLSQRAPSLDRPLSTLLLENLYDLYIEPGRSLVDQCGLTLARVVEVRRTAAGDTMVRLAANARDISTEEHGVLMDPVLIGTGGADRPGEPVGVYLTGNLCLEDDLITRRMVFLPHAPNPGDLLGFANTAGYFMDFKADHALMQPLARTVAMYQQGGSWQWCLDEDYWPVRGTVG